jgi:ribosomal 50S subunit-associated protein YjgA (DUF615 family)
MRKNPGDELAVRPNKSQLKRDSAALQELGEQLITATPGKVAKCALPEKLLAALRCFMLKVTVSVISAGLHQLDR